MKLDEHQLEWVVGEVVRRLRDGAVAETRSAAADARRPGRDVQISLTQKLVTIATLEHRLDGVTQLVVSEKAVVTPAVRDLLKERNIELIRGR